ncbi:MAG: glycosyltransferase involved in cell wall biosynthesis [Candidatus Omnitrophota bacterium]|jgi:glycosyltransferase involved in cell wall biosynthesis
MIYLISHYYHPESNPPANRFGYLSSILRDRYGDDQVEVITGFPNHPSGKLPSAYWGRLWKRRVGPEGERVLSLWEIPAPNRGFLLKTIGFLSFAASLFVYLLFKRMKPGDLIYVTSPPVFPMYVVTLLSTFKRNFRFAIDIRDLMPQIVAGMGFIKKDTWKYRTLLKWTHAAYARSEKACGVVEGICGYIDEQIAPAKCMLIYNPMDLSLLKPLDAAEVQTFRAAHPALFGDSSKVTFLFAGSHAVYMDLIGLMKALVLLKEETLNFRFILIGYGEEKENVMSFARAHGLESLVTFLGYQSRDDLVKYMCAVDFCYSSTIDQEIYQMVIPTKVLEYMSCNKFVVCVHDCPFAERLRDLGHCLLAFPERHEEIKNVLKDLIENRGTYINDVQTRAFIEEEFSLDRFRERMLVFFADLLPK